jgi:hypothetical protein
MLTQQSLGVLGAFALLGALATTSHSGAVQVAPAVQARHDGQHDLDFNIGSWSTHIRVLRALPTGLTWAELNGTAVVRKIWSGRAQLEEIEADGSMGDFEALVLFLYDPKSHQWSKSFANSSDGQLTQPMTGEFNHGRGEFFDQETYRGRMALMRAVWSDITGNSSHFEESFSYDGGRTWEPYFVATFTREGR